MFSLYLKSNLSLDRWQRLENKAWLGPAPFWDSSCIFTHKHNIEGLDTGLRIKTDFRVLILFSSSTDNKFRPEQAMSKAVKLTKVTLYLSQDFDKKQHWFP